MGRLSDTLIGCFTWGSACASPDVGVSETALKTYIHLMPC